MRAAAASEVPLIAAVGHETDVTLIDLAADRRAPTPTAAAEMAVPVRADLLERTQSLEHRLGASLRRQITERRARIDGLGRGLPAARDRLTTAGQRLDDWSERLARGARGRLAAERQAVDRLRPLKPRQLLTLLKRQQLTHAAGRLAAGHPAARIEWERRGTDQLAGRLRHAGRAALSERAGRVETTARLLESYSYRGVLARGYAVVRDERERPLTSAAEVKSGAALFTRIPRRSRRGTRRRQTQAPQDHAGRRRQRAGLAALSVGAAHGDGVDQQRGQADTDRNALGRSCRRCRCRCRARNRYRWQRPSSVRRGPLPIRLAPLSGAVVLPSSIR